MRRIITLASLSFTLFAGGAAMAAPRGETRAEARHEERREVRHEERREVRNEVRRDERYFDRAHRPVVRYERFENRAGYRWIGGQWSWNGYEWMWMPGHYIAIRAW